jgi:hypothetical protein
MEMKEACAPDIQRAAVRADDVVEDEEDELMVARD